jgi:copper chaperone CopZ
MSGGYYGGKYFPDGYFPQSYFGTEGEADPNAMRGTAAGGATATATLTAGEQVNVQIMGGWLSDEDRKRRRRERRKWREDQDEIRAALKSIYAKIKGTGKDAKPALEAVKEALKADPVHAAKSVGRVIRALGKVSHVPGVLEVQVDVRAFQRRLAEIEAERMAMAERHRIEMQDEEDLITMLLTGT